MEPLISLSQAARELGIHKSTLSRQIKDGRVRSHDGKVRLSEVREDRDEKINHRVDFPRKDAVAKPLQPATDDDDGQDAGGAGASLLDARAEKESYIAKIRRLEFEEKAGKLVSAEVVHKAVFDLARQDRDGWMNWPARVAPLMATELGADHVKLAVLLERYVREHLAERSRASLHLAGQ